MSVSLGPNGEKIGPTFAGELTVAAIPNWDFSWASDGTFTWGKSIHQNPDINAVTAVYNAHDPAKSFLLDYSENARYNKEIKGITVTGVPIETDLQSQQALHAVYTYCQIHTGTIVQWKLADLSFHSYNATEISHVFDCVNTYVQACFNTESSVNSSIKSGGINQGDGSSTAWNAAYHQIDSAYASVSGTY
jgi:hypothetical protein